MSHNLYLYATIVPPPPPPHRTHPPHPDVNSAAGTFRRQPHRPEAAHAGMARVEEELRQLDGELEPSSTRRDVRAATSPRARRKPERPSRRQRPPVPPRGRGARGRARGRRPAVAAAAQGVGEATQHHRSVDGVAPRLAKTLKNDGRDSPRIQSSRVTARSPPTGTRPAGAGRRRIQAKKASAGGGSVSGLISREGGGGRRAARREEHRRRRERRGDAGGGGQRPAGR